MRLMPRLRAVADRWVELHGLTDPSISLKTLSVRAVAHSKVFERETMYVDTFEKLVGFLAEPRNWPLAQIPDDVSAILSPLLAADAMADAA